MNPSGAFRLWSVSSCALMCVFSADAFAGARYAGCSPRCASGSYGSVRQATYNAGPVTRTYGTSSATVGDGQASYSREATRSDASSSGSATYGDGQASWNREVTTAGGKSADISGSATYGGGEANVSREATGSGGRSASSSGSAAHGGGQASVSREATVTGSEGSYGAARVGTKVTVLPAGHTTVHVGGATYHCSGGHYYQPVYVNGVTTYTVVQPPAGVVVYELPIATVKVVGGVTYYTNAGIWYRPMYVNGQVSYVVVPPPE